MTIYIFVTYTVLILKMLWEIEYLTMYISDIGIYPPIPLIETLCSCLQEVKLQLKQGMNE